MNNKKSDKSPHRAYYVKRINETIDKALNQYPRVLAVIFDLRFPDEENRLDCPTRYYDAPDVISRAFDSVKSQIKEDIKRKVKAGKRTLTCDVRYIWHENLIRKEQNTTTISFCCSTRMRIPGLVKDKQRCHLTI